MDESEGCRLDWKKVFKEILGDKSQSTHDTSPPQLRNTLPDMEAWVAEHKAAQKLMLTNSYYRPKTEGNKQIERQESLCSQEGSDEDDSRKKRIPMKKFQKRTPVNPCSVPKKQLSREEEEVEDLFYRSRCLKPDDIYESFKCLNDFDGCGVDIFKNRENCTKPWKERHVKVLGIDDSFKNLNDFDGCGVNIFKTEKVWTVPFPKGYYIPLELRYKSKLKPEDKYAKPDFPAGRCVGNISQSKPGDKYVKPNFPARKREGNLSKLEPEDKYVKPYFPPGKCVGNLKRITHADIMASRIPLESDDEVWDDDFYF